MFDPHILIFQFDIKFKIMETVIFHNLVWQNCYHSLSILSIFAVAMIHQTLAETYCMTLGSERNDTYILGSKSVLCSVRLYIHCTIIMPFKYKI